MAPTTLGELEAISWCRGPPLNAQGGGSELLQRLEWPAHRVSGYPGKEVAAQHWDTHCSKLQEVALGAITCMGVQQSTVPKWYQTGASTGG